MKRKQQILNYLEFNDLLERVEKFSMVIYDKVYKDALNSESLECFSFCDFKPKNVELTTKYGPNMLPTTYIFTRDDTVESIKQGSEEFGIFKRAIGSLCPDFTEDEWTLTNLGRFEGKFTNRQSPWLAYNPDFNGKRVYSHCYDLNSAYLSCIYNTIPDTRTPSYNRIVEENEIGFIVCDGLVLISPGNYAEIIFPLIETPKRLRAYCERWYKRKKNKVPGAKHQINDPIGYLQYHNPYLRAYIVETCNRKMIEIRKQIGDHFIRGNTDCITADVELPWLDIGGNIGQFKHEEGYIVINKHDYDADFGSAHRGVQQNNFYDVINNRLVRKETNNG